MKNILASVFIVVAFLGVLVFINNKKVPVPVAKEIIYTNNDFGFSVSLPASWKGYTVVLGTSEIRSVSDGAIVAKAPIFNIRHPLWTKNNPRQDIPINIYTLAHWAGITSEKYSVGAAPIPPSELARNSKFVFALPARYNYAYPSGYEEVEQIIANKMVKAFEPLAN